jgi:hypothetical protein
MEVVQGWVGPLEGAQDFVLPWLRIEVKTVRPGASTFRASSVDQLDVSDVRLVLFVVTLVTLGPGIKGQSVAELIADVRQGIAAGGGESAVLEFESRLAAGGYIDLPEYQRQKIRVEAVRSFGVQDGFPRLRRSDLPAGVAGAIYDIEISACAPFEIQSAEVAHGHS